MSAWLSYFAIAMAPPPTVHVFVITGGPCAGKTTALAHLLENRVEVFTEAFNLEVVPEAATLYHQYGARLPFGVAPSTCGTVSASERNLVWEMLLNELKRTLEARTVNSALRNNSKPSIVLCDRGIYDSRAYLPDENAWDRMLRYASWDDEGLAARYDHVFHLAMCPEAAYSTASNSARRESFEEALALDECTWDAWHYSHADAHTLVSGQEADDTIEGKLDALCTAMRQRLGLWDQPVATLASRPPSLPRREGWYLPPETIIALADTVASSADLSQVVPTAISIVRRTGRVDHLRPQRPRLGGAAVMAGEKAQRSASVLGARVEREGTDTDSGLVF